MFVEFFVISGSESGGSGFQSTVQCWFAVSTRVYLFCCAGMMEFINFSFGRKSLFTLCVRRTWWKKFDKKWLYSVSCCRGCSFTVFLVRVEFVYGSRKCLFVAVGRKQFLLLQEKEFVYIVRSAEFAKKGWQKKDMISFPVAADVHLLCP